MEINALIQTPPNFSSTDIPLDIVDGMEFVLDTKHYKVKKVISENVVAHEDGGLKLGSVSEYFCIMELY